MQAYIYSISCPINSEVRYIGRSKKVQARFRSHISMSLKDRCANKNLQNWILSLLSKGIEPVFTVLETCSIDDVSIREAIHIEKYNPTGLLFNMDKFSCEHREINVGQLLSIVKSKRVKLKTISDGCNVSGNISAFLNGRKWSLSIDKARKVRDYILEL